MPPSTNPATAFPTTGTADLLSQMPSLPLPLQNSQGPPFYPPPGPPPQYGYPAPGGNQYHAAGVDGDMALTPPPAFPGTVPQPGVPQPTHNVPHQVEQTQGHAEVGQMPAAKQPAPTVFRPKKNTPNEQVHEGAWSDLSCEADFTDAMVHVADRAAVGCTRDVCLEVKNVIRKTCAPAKGKCTWAEDIPPQTPANMASDVNHLHELQDGLLCMTHSKLGIRLYCWIELAEEGVKGGHREFSHNKLMLWAKYIARGLATTSCPPNIKKIDYPPTKKTKAMQPAPEFHIAVNLASTQGEGGTALLGGTCVMSDAPIQQPQLVSAPGPVHAEQAVAGSSQLCSAPDPLPLGRKVYIPRVRKTLLEMLSACAQTGRVPSSHNILTWLDTEHSDEDGLYMESFSDFQAFGIDDAFDIMEREVCYLATFGHLGQGGAQRLCQYTRDKILFPLDLWTTKNESIGSPLRSADNSTIFKWQNGIQEGYIEDI
ncbi:hypothetical protein EI94DRAFT_1813546 [Lactarius quietus]|nr:hypothetical protein EI94DRAFT_1813546 [Lactarius quietus]